MVDVVVERVGDGNVFRVRVVGGDGSECTTRVYSIIYNDEGASVTLYAECNGEKQEVRIIVGV